MSVPPQPPTESWRHLTSLDTSIYKMTDTFCKWIHRYSVWRRAVSQAAVSHCSSLIFTDFFLQARERENSGCPLYLEQRRQHGHLQTSFKYKFIGCPFSPLASSQSVQGYSQNISSVCLSPFGIGSL